METTLTWESVDKEADKNFGSFSKMPDAKTEEIKEALELAEISLQGHIILAYNDYFSFRKNGLI